MQAVPAELLRALQEGGLRRQGECHLLGDRSLCRDRRALRPGTDLHQPERRQRRQRTRHPGRPVERRRRLGFQRRPAAACITSPH